MPFTPEEIEHKQFLVALRGYERAEVEGFLRAVADDVRRLTASAAVTGTGGQALGDDGVPGYLDRLSEILHDSAATARQRLERAEARSLEILAAAEAAAGETQRQAALDADTMVAAAHDRANRMITEAARVAEGMVSDSRRAAARVASVVRAIEYHAGGVEQGMAKLRDEVRDTKDMLGAVASARVWDDSDIVPIDLRSRHSDGIASAPIGSVAAPSAS